MLWRYPQLVVGLVAGAFALALAVLSGPVLVAASGTAAFGSVVEAVPDAANANERPVVRAVLAGVTSGPVEDVVSARMAGLPEAGELVVTRRPIGYLDFAAQPEVVVSNPATGATSVAVPFSASGAVDGLVPTTEGVGGTGVWVPDVVASELGVGPGDEVAYSINYREAGLRATEAGLRETVVEVAGVYATIEGDAVPVDGTGVWADLADQLPPWPIGSGRETPQVPLLVADRAVFEQLVAEVGEVGLTVWQVGLAAVAIEEAERLAAAAERLDREAFDPTGNLRTMIDDASEGMASLEVFTGIDRLVEQGRRARAETADGVSSVRVIGVGVSALVVVLAGLASAWRRRDERQALLDAGRSPVQLAALAAVESLVVVGVGTALAVVALPWFVSGIVGVAGPALSVAAIGGVVAVSVGLLAATSGVQAWRVSRAYSGRAEESVRRLPWRVVVVAVGVVIAVPVLLDDERGFSTGAALFPVAVLAAAAVGVGELFRTAASAVRRVWSPGRLVARLLVARSSRDRAVAAAVMATTMAFGAVAYTTLSAEAVAEASEDKATAQAGSNATVRIPTATLLDDGAADAAGVPEASTVVWRLPLMQVDEERAGLLAVTPEAFLDGALWSPRYGTDDPVALMGALTAGTGGFLPVVTEAARAVVPDRGVLTRNGFEDVPYEVVGRVAALPGGFDDRPTLLVDAASLFERGGPSASPLGDVFESDDPDGVFVTEVWSTRPIGELVADLRAADVPFDEPTTLAGALAQPTLLARGWTVDYLLAFAAVAAVLGLVIVVGTSLRDRARRRLQTRALVDLGHRGRTMGWVNVLEVTLIGVAGTAAGALLARPVVAVIADRLDPLPTQAPALTVGAGTAVVAAAAVAFVVAATAASALAGLVPARTSINEALRDE
ncbi:MAG: hypothetical protein V3S75_04335 [Euzebya tangerina]